MSPVEAEGWRVVLREPTTRAVCVVAVIVVFISLISLAGVLG